MARLLTYDECDRIWKEDGRGRTGDRLAYYRALQDKSYRIPDNSETFVARFKKGFPLNENCQSGKILDFGFKELMAAELDAEEMYEERLGSLMQKRRGGEYSTLLEACAQYASKNHAAYLQRLENGSRSPLRKFSWVTEETWTPQDWITAVCLDHQRGSRGVAAEARVHKELKKAFSRYPKLFYREAPYSLERYDVDALLTGPLATEKISIKNYWALSPSYIERERRGKTEPTLYLGYKNENSVKMTAYNPSGKQVAFGVVLERVGV